MARLTLLAMIALLVGTATAGTATATTHNLGRVLAQAAAQAPAPAAPAAAASTMSANAAGATIVTAGAASLAGGKLTLKQASPIVTADTMAVGGAIPSTLESIVAASKPGEPAYAVLSSASGGGADGKAPLMAILEISDPVMKGDTVTLNAKYLSTDGKATPLKGGAVEAAMKQPTAAGPPPAAFDAKTVSLAVDNAAPAQTSAEPGEKSIIGAAVGEL